MNEYYSKTWVHPPYLSLECVLHRSTFCPDDSTLKEHQSGRFRSVDLQPYKRDWRRNWWRQWSHKIEILKLKERCRKFTLSVPIVLCTRELIPGSSCKLLGKLPQRWQRIILTVLAAPLKQRGRTAAMGFNHCTSDLVQV